MIYLFLGEIRLTLQEEIPWFWEASHSLAHLALFLWWRWNHGPQHKRCLKTFFNFYKSFKFQGGWCAGSVARTPVLAFSMGARKEAQEPVKTGSQGEQIFWTSWYASIQKPFPERGIILDCSIILEPGPFGGGSCEEKHSDQSGAWCSPG